MRRMFWMTLAGVLLGSTVATTAPKQGKGHKKAQDGHATHATTADRPDSHVNVHVVFGSGDVTLIREHYAPRYRNLPPGLQKKVARGGQLPPGWRKKFEPFPVALERRLVVLPSPYRRGVIDGHAVIYNSRSNVVIDVAVLF
jgi:hypothetical protein